MLHLSTILAHAKHYARVKDKLSTLHGKDKHLQHINRLKYTRRNLKHYLRNLLRCSEKYVKYILNTLKRSDCYKHLILDYIPYCDIDH